MQGRRFPGAYSCPVTCPRPEDLAWTARFRRLVAGSGQTLIGLAGQELGKDRFETLTSEIVPLLASCRWHERHARRVLRPRRPIGGSVWQLGQRHRVERAPLGRVAIIATWNYPVQLLGVQLVQALVGGNSVVVKPSERTPRTQLALLEMALAAGVPGDRLRWTEPDREAGARLLAEETFDHVVFTGATPTGRAIAGTLAGKLTPSTLELSGQDSALVLGDADPDLAARSIAYAATLNSGQTCMAPRRVIVHRSLAEPLVDGLRREFGARAPLPLDPAEFQRCRALVEEAVNAGGRLVAPPEDVGTGVRPAIVADCPPGTALAAGAHFGPAVAVLTAASDEEIVALAGRYGRRLATSVFTRDTRRARRLAPELGSTTVTINDCVIPTGHPGVSIGGRGESGWGLTRGEAGLLAMTRPVYTSRTGRRIRTPLTPPSARTAARVERFIRWRYGR